MHKQKAERMARQRRKRDEHHVAETTASHADAKFSLAQHYPLPKASVLTQDTWEHRFVQGR